MPKFDIAKEKPKPVEKPEPPKETKKQQATDFNALLNKLTTPDKPVKNAKAGPRVIQGIGAGNVMTADLADALQEPDLSLLVAAGRCAQCPAIWWWISTWRSIPTARSGRLQMTMGTAAAAAGNPYTRAAAEAASRAIYQCQPYRLPRRPLCPVA